MDINILGTESLGVRGLSCCVKLENRTIVIDPGIALGWQRHGHHPHPFQVAIGAKIRAEIIKELESTTDVIFSHFDGDHVPLANANPYQLSINSVKQSLSHINIWAKEAVPSSILEKRRRAAIESAIGRNLPNVALRRDGAILFSSPIPHGLRSEDAVSVMMTRIEEDGVTFVHASDIQFIHPKTIDAIIALEPDVVLSSGPPLYLSLLSKNQRQRAKQNVLRLAQHVETLIIDHHLLRSEEGERWLDELRMASGHHVLCGADYMGKERLFLEAWRGDLYQWLPVPEGWHEAYKRGDADFEPFIQSGWKALIRYGKITPSSRSVN